MLQKFVSIILFCILTINCFSQSTTVTGVLQDTSAGVNIRHATVSIIGQDSMLQTFTRANTEGNFSVTIPTPGSYTLLIAHPNYADYKETIIASGKNISLQKITLINRAKLLQEVIIKQKGSIRIKGDTTVYLADSFKVDDNANVEELLKLLPGVEVDKDGKITTQGEQVQKVLVDGEEFFGDDPTVATRNLAAKVIDKVEVFDSKSEQSKFTGFDDGTKEKTINLKMKENMNHGVFGKVQAAGGTKPNNVLAKNLYDNAGMINAFKNKRKLSAYAINSSTGTTGLNWNDQSKFGDGGNSDFDEEEGYFMRWNSSDDEGEGGYNGEGFPNVNNIGLQYSNKWMEGKHAVNGNLNSKNNSILQAENGRNTNYIGNINIATTDSSTSNVNRHKQSGKLKYEWTVDTTATLTLNVGGSFGNTQTKSTYNSMNTNNDDFASSSIGNKEFNSNSNSANADLTWKKKLKKIGRTYSINGTFSNTQKLSDTKILGLNKFGTNAVNINQWRNGDNVLNRTSARIVYTEPLIKDKLLTEISYQINNSNTENLQITNVQSLPDGAYDIQIDSLSNDFASNIFGNTIGIKFKYKLKKINIGIGNNVKYSIFNQTDKIRNIDYDYNRLNLFPSLNFNYKISQFSNLRFNYNGSTQQPSVSQLQNVYDNSDPLNISIGNPNLKQEYNQNININYWNYKAFTERSMWAGFYGSNTYNNMINTINFEPSTGRTINSYTNINGTFNVGTYIGYNAKIPKSNFKYSININTNLNKRPTVVNGSEQINIAGNYELVPSLSYRKAKKFDATFSNSLQRQFFINKSAVATNNAYFTYHPSGNVNWFPTKRSKVSSDIEYNYRQAVAPFTTNFKRTIWNAALTYKLLKQKNLECSLVANDILNQNIGYEREVFGNTISERNFLTIGRNFMARVIYNFSHGPVSKLPTEEEDNF
jgi:hypothetical protein